MAWVEIAGVGTVGVAADPLPHSMKDSVLSSVLNVSCSAQGVERVRGRSFIGPTSLVDPHWLLPFATAAGARRVIQCGLAKIYSNDFTTQTNITRAAGDYTGGVDDRWTGGVLHGIAVANNGVDKPQFWAGTGLMADLTNWPATWKCAALRTFRNFLVALGVTKNTTRYPYLVNWSHPADPGTLPTSWDIADATKDAGEFPLSETSGDVVDGLSFGERFYVYKTDSIYEMQFIGQPQIFRFSKVSDTYGLLARNCVVSTPSGQVALTGGDLVLVSGSGVRSLVTNRMRRWLFSNIDGASRARCFLAANPKRNEVYVCFPELGETTCTMALVWNWETDLLSVRKLTAARHAAPGLLPMSATRPWSALTGTWDDQAYGWNAADYGDTDPRLLWTGPQLMAQDQGMTDIGAPIISRVERTGLTFGDAARVKCVRGIRPNVEAPAGTVLLIRIGAQMEPGGGVRWSGLIPFTVGQNVEAYGFATGRLLAYRIESAGPQFWRLTSVALDVVPMGLH